MYEQKIGFLDGVKRALGFDIGRIELENRYGQTVGYEWKGKKFEYARPIEKFSDYLNTPVRDMGLTRANRFMDAGGIISKMNQSFSRSQIETALEKSTFGSVAGFKPDGFSRWRIDNKEILKELNDLLRTTSCRRITFYLTSPFSKISG